MIYTRLFVHSDFVHDGSTGIRQDQHAHYVITGFEATYLAKNMDAFSIIDNIVVGEQMY